MNWTAVVPLRQGQNPKSRLSSCISLDDRIRLSAHMAETVVQALHEAGDIGHILLLSPETPTVLANVEWRRDAGRGLNAELDALRRELHDQALLVIHGDLPLVGPDDIVAMIAGAEGCGCAIAPDRHGTGTNGVAITPNQGFSFAFGEGSMARHLACAPGAAVIRRPGVSIDIDTPHDLRTAIMAGFQPPVK
jgi:2-phospho-L-lactate guanylyltransferase